MNRRLPLLFALLMLPLLVGSLIFTNQLHAGTADICLLPSVCTYASIQDAVSNGPENTPLTIAAGVYQENISISRSVILVGAGSSQTIIDGDAADSVVMVSGAVNVSISGVTLRNGDATGVDGGGLLNETATVTLSDSVIENNIAPNGAGITNDGTMILDNVTVRNNTADEFVGNVSICSTCAGGGILNLSVMTITNSIIHGNTADFGGGIDNAAMADLTATNITVYDNTATNASSQGGGIENLGDMSVASSEIHTNTARNGAGIYNEGELTISGSDIHDNVAGGNGGGLQNMFGLTVQNSSIHNNQAGNGGGISTQSGTVNLDRSAVYSNVASGSGGGIYNNVEAITGPNKLTITNSTISGNSAAGVGGGLRSMDSAVTELSNVTFRNNSSIVQSGQSISILAGTMTVKNTILAISGSGTNCGGGGVITSQGYNLASDGSCQLTATGDLTNTNPQLGVLQNNGGPTFTHALLLGSPAINSGSGCLAVDQRGVARPFGPACDRGAYEYDKVIQSVYLPLVLRP